MVSKHLVSFFKNPYRLINVLLFVGFVTALLAPLDEANAQSGNVYSSRSVQSASPALRAVVLQSREVGVEPQQQNRYAGGAAGATIGGAVMSTVFGRNSNTARVGMGIVGAIFGGLAGQAVADHIGGPVAIEYIVQVEPQGREQPRVMAITQPAPGPVIGQGARVFLVQTQGTWRVLPVYEALSSGEALPQSEQRLSQEVLKRSYRYKTSQLDAYVASR